MLLLTFGLHTPTYTIYKYQTFGIIRPSSPPVSQFIGRSAVLVMTFRYVCVCAIHLAASFNGGSSGSLRAVNDTVVFEISTAISAWRSGRRTFKAVLHG